MNILEQSMPNLTVDTFHMTTARVNLEPLHIPPAPTSRAEIHLASGDRLLQAIECAAARVDATDGSKAREGLAAGTPFDHLRLELSGYLALVPATDGSITVARVFNAATTMPPPCDARKL